MSTVDTLPSSIVVTNITTGTVGLTNILLAAGKSRTFSLTSMAKPYRSELWQAIHRSRVQGFVSTVPTTDVLTSPPFAAHSYHGPDAVTYNSGTGYWSGGPIDQGTRLSTTGGITSGGPDDQGAPLQTLGGITSGGPGDQGEAFYWLGGYLHGGTCDGGALVHGHLLLEGGSALLLESGSYLLLE